MPQNVARRTFLRSIGGAALAAPAILRAGAIGSDSKLNIAGIGVGGKGESDIAHCEGENVIALCDVDQENARAAFDRFPHATRYRDYRKLLDAEGKRLDAVTVSTPDHHHAAASLRAMRMGKHVYCQKPLTQTIAEARMMADTAREKKVATQMGNQGMSHPRTRRLVELIQAGVLGVVKEVHAWTDRPIWPQAIERPSGSPPVPPTLDWDAWLGPAPPRPYHPDYVPFKWRGFWDFGTGALGDMACHNLGMPFWALDLRDPLTVEAAATTLFKESAPAGAVIVYELGARGALPPLKLTWYDGGLKPLSDVGRGRKLPSNGVILVGEKDTLHVPSYWGGGEFFSGARMDDFKDVPERLPRRTGDERDNGIDWAHKQEWLAACRGGPPASSSFPESSGPLTELVLLGNVAIRSGKKLHWDASAMKVANDPDANQFVHGTYRPGWEI